MCDTSEADAKKAHAFIAKFADEHYGRKAIVPIDVDYYFNTESQKNFFEALPASEAWIEERLEARKKVTGFEEQTMPPARDGRSFKMSGRRLPDKTFIQIFTDVTDLKQREI